MPYVLADTGVWYALCDSRDSFHSRALSGAGFLERHHVVLPWPVVYETLCTRFVRNTTALRRFVGLLKRPRIEYLDDSMYVQSALDIAIESSLSRARPLSTVDCAIRLVLDDVNIRVDYLMTFNPADFLDVCERRRIRLLEMA